MKRVKRNQRESNPLFFFFIRDQENINKDGMDSNGEESSGKNVLFEL